MYRLLLSKFIAISKQLLTMGSYCPVCDEFVENLDVCSKGEYHRDDPSCDYERYPMRDFSKWYTPPEPEPETTLTEKIADDEVWFQSEVRTRSKTFKHRKDMVIETINKLITKIGVTYEKVDKIKLFEEILLIYKNHKWILKNKALANVTILKIDEFSDDSAEFNYLKSFKYQLFGVC